MAGPELWAGQAVRRSGQVAFLVFVVAVGVSLLFAQRLRRSDPVVLGAKRTVAFSPVGSGPRAAAVSFYLKRGDTVAVSIVDSRGDLVRKIANGRDVPARKRVRFVWFGTGADGRRAEDGSYRFRVGLTRQGRSVTIPYSVQLDTAPAQPRVVRVIPGHPPGPFLLPAARSPIGIIGGTLGRDVSGLVIRTDIVPAKVVERRLLPHVARKFPWDGLVDGQPAADGVYMLGIIETDQAGNKGSFPPRLEPIPGPVRGRPGVTVRRLGVSPPALPAKAGSLVTVSVDPRGKKYDWALRNLSDGPPLARGSTRAARLRVRIPARTHGLLKLAVVGNGRRAEVPVAVIGHRAPTLVVLPAIRWQGVARVDQSGDGLPDMLTRGGSVHLDRVLPPISGGLAGLQSDVVPLLGRLSQSKTPTVITTDIALATGRGPRLSAFRGVILAGEESWLPSRTLEALRGWVKRGGHLLNLGNDSLRRTVEIRGTVASNPSPARKADAFGAVLGRPVSDPSELLVWRDSLGLFSQTGGLLIAPPGSIASLTVEAPGKLRSAAGAKQGDPASAAWRFGRGLVIRPGIEHLARLAGNDAQALGLINEAIRLTAGR